MSSQTVRSVTLYYGGLSQNDGKPGGSCRRYACHSEVFVQHAKGIFAVEDNKPDCIEKLEKLTSGEPRMEVAKLMTKYPQGGERQLIYAVTKRAINSSMLPADVGCVVDNVETIIHIYDAVVNGRPCIDRVVTVSGDGIMNPGNFKFRLA